MESKPWYLSKTIWAGVLTLLLTVYNMIPTTLGIAVPTIPDFVYAILGALGIYGRVTATTTVK